MTADLEIRKITGPIMIVDDEPSNVRLLETMLVHAGCTKRYTTTDPRLALEMCARWRPDAVLLDLIMPHLDGITLLGQLAERFPDRLAMPILVLTADASKETKYRVLQAGASDFLTKPLDALEVVLRLGNHLTSRSLHLEVTESNALLEKRVEERTWALEAAQGEIIDRLSTATEMRDDATGGHVQRVAKVTARIAKAMGIAASTVDILSRAVRLHDVGKISVPDRILLKEGKLTDDERIVMREHAAAGSRILGGSRFPVLVMAEEIARHHHERWDGTGYPDRLAGEDIPLSARIAAVADVFDALTHARPYKQAWSISASVVEIRRMSGTQFDPRVVDAFGRIVDEKAGLQAGAQRPHAS